jgi:hypothetical protein
LVFRPPHLELEGDCDMRKLLMTAAAVGLSAAGLVSVASTSVKAGPICLTDKESSGTFQSCEFYSFRACRASQDGVGGTCVRNPYGDDDAYSEGLMGGPVVEYGSSYNRYDGPIYGGGYVRSYRAY